MKAYIVQDKDEYGGATVVFAESRGAARSAAMNTETCDGLEYMEIRATRAPAMDQFYKEGKKEMDWYNMEDRVAMVVHAGFACEEIYDLARCENCPAHDECWQYESEIEEMAEE